ncbi:hypothetical protein [Streptacidiphilus pinicola]|uniref:hypothetical protein n=1 Tax=Streptacidiphilus pinicola TaxID=2219663 RepID=UPI00105775D5|nr:hypothetical protein [Streptacidiphilus pinicola]
MWLVDPHATIRDTIVRGLARSAPERREDHMLTLLEIVTPLVCMLLLVVVVTTIVSLLCRRLGRQ